MLLYALYMYMYVVATATTTSEARCTECGDGMYINATRKGDIERACNNFVRGGGVGAVRCEAAPCTFSLCACYVKLKRKKKKTRDDLIYDNLSTVQTRKK